MPACLLRTGDEVIENDGQPAQRARSELGHRRHEVVGAVHRLDDDAELAKVVAPDMLDQFGVMPTLDPDPARARALW